MEEGTPQVGLSTATDGEPVSTSATAPGELRPGGDITEDRGSPSLGVATQAHASPNGVRCRRAPLVLAALLAAAALFTGGFALFAGRDAGTDVTAAPGGAEGVDAPCPEGQIPGASGRCRDDYRDRTTTSTTPESSSTSATPAPQRTGSGGGRSGVDAMVDGALCIGVDMVVGMQHRSNIGQRAVDDCRVRLRPRAHGPRRRPACSIR